MHTFWHDLQEAASVMSRLWTKTLEMEMLVLAAFCGSLGLGEIDLELEDRLLQPPSLRSRQKWP